MKKAFHVAYGVCIAAACMLFSGVSVKAVGGVAIDSGNFPDDGFRKIVSEKCDKDKDGELSALEISETKSLIVGDNHDDGFADITQEQTGSIKSIKGIEYFTELTDLFIGFADTYEHRYAVVSGSLKEHKA